MSSQVGACTMDNFRDLPLADGHARQRIIVVGSISYINIVTMSVGSPPILFGLLPAGVVSRFGTPNPMVIMKFSHQWPYIEALPC